MEAWRYQKVPGLVSLYRRPIAIRGFSLPLEYDPTRTDAHNLLDFGGGVYTCLGKHVAMIEIQEALAELISNYPNAQVTNFDISSNPFVNEVAELKVDLVGAST